MARLILICLLFLATPSWGAACPVTGKGGDPDQNALKNRTEIPAGFEALALDIILETDVPDGVRKNSRSRWPAETRDELAALEDRAVETTGYLLDASLEGREHCNCDSTDPSERDIHLWLGSEPGSAKAHALVIEITPRIRAEHPSWTSKALRRLIKAQAMVRVSGWLMLDPEHPEQLEKTRATLWEIHPVMQLEYFDATSSTWSVL
jgi:hypothetical protein